MSDGVPSQYKAPQQSAWVSVSRLIFPLPRTKEHSEDTLIHLDKEVFKAGGVVTRDGMRKVLQKAKVWCVEPGKPCRIEVVENGE